MDDRAPTHLRVDTFEDEVPQAAAEQTRTLVRIRSTPSRISTASVEARPLISILVCGDAPGVCRWWRNSGTEGISLSTANSIAIPRMVQVHSEAQLAGAARYPSTAAPDSNSAAAGPLPAPAIRPCARHCARID
jgi:hypothetical protein